MRKGTKKGLAAIGGGLAAAFAVVVLHPVILPVALVGGGVVGWNAIRNKNNGPDAPKI